MRSVLDGWGSHDHEQWPEPNKEATALFHPDGQPVTTEDRPFVRAFGGDVVDAEELHGRAQDGSTRVLEISAFPIPSPSGAPPRVQEVIRDGTTTATLRESLVSFAGSVAQT